MEKLGGEEGRKCWISSRGEDLSLHHVPQVYLLSYKTHHNGAAMVYQGVMYLRQAEGCQKT